ncbi:MAG: membrane-bound lytic murein transglycosylase MltF [Gammaproteobacteria bacterium]
MNHKNHKEKWGQKSNIQRLFLSVLYVLVLSSCGDQKTILEKIRESGELRFATVESPLTYFKGSDGKAEGIEFDLASMFADSLNLDLNLIIVKNKHDVASLINKNKAHIGSSALALSGYPNNTLEYGPAYITARRQLVYHQKNRKPRSIAYIKEDEIVIGEDQSYQTLLKKLSFFHPDLSWRVLKNKSMTEILKMVNDNKVPIAIADSNWVDMYRHVFPEVRVAFDITGELPVAWVYRSNRDHSLDKAVRKFFNHINKNGSLDKLVNHYYKHAKSFDYIDTRVFIENVHNTLPKYRKLFIKSAKETKLDWFLLAAISYQESHWNPKAKSSTGVRGLMMLTTDTAKSLGVEDRLDPEQSILGGARYLNKMINRIPERIQGEDRVWFALAAYNVGFGHLQDARILTQSQGGDADKWLDVRERLPLLADEKWHQKTEHGYARGGEPVSYVKNIQRYYDILKWKNAEIERVVQQKSQGKNKVLPIINSPVL